MRSIGRRTSWRVARALVLLGVVGGLADCGSVEPVAPAAAPITDPTQLYVGLTLDHPAITMSTVAPYNTLQLTATPRDGLGIPMTGLPAPTYTSSDTTKVKVTADGLVTAVGTGFGVQIRVRLTAGQVTHVDTARINVTSQATPPTLDSLSIHPVPPDSAIWSLFYDNQIAETMLFNLYDLGYQQVTPALRDTGGNPIAPSGVQITYTSLDPAIATIDRRSGSVVVWRAGDVRMVAQATVYGVTKADTAAFTVTPPIGDDVLVTAGPAFHASYSAGDIGGVLKEVHIVTGGLVMWYSYAPDSVHIEFDDPTNVVRPTDEECDIVAWMATHPLVRGNPCGAGDMWVSANPLAEGGLERLRSMRFRKFPVPGVYPFHITGTNVSAKVVVGS